MPLHVSSTMCSSSKLYYAASGIITPVFTVSLFHASTCFEHHALIIRRSKLYYTVSGIITPVGGRPSLNLCT